MCTVMVYVEIGLDPSRLPSFSSLAAADLRLFGGVQLSNKRTAVDVLHIAAVPFQ
jgi:hypothetical protein